MAGNDYGINRENPKSTRFDPNADYSINIPGLPEEVNRRLSDACCRVAKNGTENQCEALELIDLDTGATRYAELGDYDSVGGGKFWEHISDNPNGKYAFVHNHPTDGFLSSIDMQTFAGNASIQMMISTSNDGLKRIVYGDIKKPDILFDVYYEKRLEEVRKRLKAGLLEPIDYSYECQKAVVEQSIDEFGNLGFWEVDGRV